MKAFFFFLVLQCSILPAPWRKFREDYEAVQKTPEDNSLCGSLLGTGCSESRCQQETRIRQAGSQGLPGLHAGGLGAGLAEPGNCHSTQGPLCLLPEADRWEGGTGQDTDAMAIHVCVCVGLHPPRTALSSYDLEQFSNTYRSFTVLRVWN